MTSARSPSRRRVVAFALLVAVCAAGAALATFAGARSGRPAAPASAGARTAIVAARAERRPIVVYRVEDPHRPGGGGQVAVSSLDAPDGPRTLTSMSCDRVDFSAGGAGICLTRGRGFAAGYEAKVFGPDLAVRHTIGVDGIPSRARVSPDGRYGAVTLFVTGDSYADTGSFSTRTTIIDLAAGRKVADLEDFVIMHGQRRVTAVDVNLWGVTFARDSDRFYATLATGGRTYLIEGSVSAHTARVIHDNVECPSLSPDGRRIAYKKRTGSAERPWRLTVLDLATMRETPLAEARSVDDQAEWLDDGHVLYGVGGSVWEVPADGGGPPRRFIARAASPAVVRW
jgi:hypothetical protein